MLIFFFHRNVRSETHVSMNSDFKMLPKCDAIRFDEVCFASAMHMVTHLFFLKKDKFRNGGDAVRLFGHFW